MTHDLPGPTFRLLSKDVAYLKLSSIQSLDIPRDIQSAKGTRGLIVDIRNYPSDFVVFALGSLLIRQSTPFVFPTTPDLSNPGAFHAGPPISLTPSEPHYAGKVVILVDEVTQSSAEYTAMALRSTPNAIVIGSTTAGADGNVSTIPLPGGLRTMISGLGVFIPMERRRSVSAFTWTSKCILPSAASAPGAMRFSNQPSAKLFPSFQNRM